MGLITNEKTGNMLLLSDILGDEDHLGDMDFKVCGTEKVLPPAKWILKSTAFRANY